MVIVSVFRARLRVRDRERVGGLIPNLRRRRRVEDCGFSVLSKC